jgi:hypothetical protein
MRKAILLMVGIFLFLQVFAWVRRMVLNQRQEGSRKAFFRRIRLKIPAPGANKVAGSPLMRGKRLQRKPKPLKLAPSRC